jgi:hypothetical protein
MRNSDIARQRIIRLATMPAMWRDLAYEAMDRRLVLGAGGMGCSVFGQIDRTAVPIVPALPSAPSIKSASLSVRRFRRRPTRASSKGRVAVHSALGVK